MLCSKMMMLRRGVRTLTGGGHYTPSSISRSFSTAAISSSSMVSARNVACVRVAANVLLDSNATVVTEPTLLQTRVVIYDGVCHLCHRGVKWIIKADKDKRIKFCCLQSKAAEPYLTVSGLEREDVLRRFLFIEGPGLYHQGSTAALKVLSYLPLPYSALSTLTIVPTPLRDIVYDYIAKRRYSWFGKGDDCLVLKEKELLERFIDREEMLDREKREL